MIRKTSLTILVELAMLPVSNTLFAQDSAKVVILSPRVGPVIDAAEREYFHLFQQIKDFHSAVMLENPDSTYYAWIVLEEANGNTKDTAVWYSRSYLLMLTQQINHFEELTEGKYQMGQNPATLQVIESEEARGAPAVAKPRGEARPNVVEAERVLIASRSEGAKVVLQPNASTPSKNSSSRLEGARVVLQLDSGQQFSGQLLSVRDSALVISIQNGSLLTIRNQEILYVVVKGESRVFEGMGTGFLAGAAWGALTGLARGDDSKNQIPSFTAGQKAVVGGIAFGAVGFLVGTIAGIASSSGDKLVKPLRNNDFSSLKPFARFQGNEPSVLNGIKIHRQ